MPRRDSHEKKPDLPYDRALPAIEEQLARLQSLKGRSYDEAADDEKRWYQLTEAIIERAFGNPSTNLTNLHWARTAGEHYIGGMTPAQLQRNYDLRMREFESLLRSLVEEMQLFAPAVEIKGAYEAGDQYALYRDLSAILSTAARDAMIVDAYLDERIFNLYVEKVAPGVAVRILSSRIGANVEEVARMFAARRSLELRVSPTIHDRFLFLDDRAWAIGQSLKDAAKTKPTYLVELMEPGLTALQTAHESVWLSASVVI